MAHPPRGLGRGLEALIPTNAKQEKTGPSVMVPLGKIRANRYQPRSRFDETALKELAESIRQQGLIQPLVLTALTTPENGVEFELIAGERRWRAAHMAGLSEVPAVVKKVTEREQFQMSLIENIQREDLNPVEEGVAYKRLMEEFSLTQEELARVIGKSRVVVANTLRLLNLPQEIRDAVSDGTISAGHARSLVSISDEKLQREVAEKILKERLTVRDVEKIVSDWKGAIAGGKVKVAPLKDADLQAAEDSLQRALGTKVDITARGKGKSLRGSIRISFFSLEDLERLIGTLKKQ